MQQKSFQHSGLLSWKSSIQNPVFLYKLGIGGILLIGLLSFLPDFFEEIEQRPARVLNDYLLKKLPAVDLSLPIFLLVWGSMLLLFYRFYHRPRVFLTALYTFIFITTTRITCIQLVSLGPPHELVPLVDPFTNFFMVSTIL